MHPDELDLMEFIDGGAPPAVREHVATCARCRQLVDAAAPAGPLPDPSTTTGQPQIRIPDRLHQALVRDLPPSVKAGQLWRARWDDTTVLIVLLQVDDDEAIALPVSFDTHLASHETLLVDEAESPVGVPLGIWTTARVTAPFALLERYLGVFPADVVGTVRQVMDRTQERSTARTGSHSTSALDERGQFASELATLLTSLAGRAQWSPATSDEAPPLAAVLQEAGLDVADLGQLLEVDVPTALALARGDRPLTPGQQVLLDAEAARRGAATLPSTAAGRRPPGELVSRLSQPTIKPRILAEAAREQTAETDVRLGLANRCHELALAARLDRKREPDWDEIIHQVLR